MTLSEHERQLFFNNWLGLLAFINDKYRLVKKFGHPKSPLGLRPDVILPLKNKLWENRADIDEYIDSVGDMNEENIQILKGWKKGVTETFIILKHLKKYSIFLADGKAYGVIGITSSISEAIDSDRLPGIVGTTLIPFGKRIIYDSIFCTHNISIGPNMRRNFNEEYNAIKKERGIITQL